MLLQWFIDTVLKKLDFTVFEMPSREVSLLPIPFSTIYSHVPILISNLTLPTQKQTGMTVNQAFHSSVDDVLLDYDFMFFD